MKAFGMFALTKREQRLIIIVVLALTGLVLARHYRETGTIFPIKTLPAAQASPTAAPSTDDEADGQQNAP